MLPAGVQVVGAGIDRTVVSPAIAESVTGLFLLTNRASVVRQLTLTGTFAKTYADGNGGTVRIEAGLLEDCCVRDVVMGSGEICGNSIAAVGANASLSRVTVRNCRGGKWGTVYLNSRATMANCLVHGCEVNGALSSSYIPYGGGVYVDSSGGSVTNCTFAGAQTNTVYNYCPTLGKFVNCVFDCPSDNTFKKQYKDPETDKWIIEYYIGTNNFYHCASSIGNPIIEAHAVENGNLSEVDLMLADPVNADYHLLPGSPCLRTGLYEPWMRETRDLDGRRRASRDMIDLGCYQDTVFGFQLLVR